METMAETVLEEEPVLVAPVQVNAHLNERALLLILSAVQLANIMDFMIVMPLEPALQRFFDTTPWEFGLIVSSYTFSACVSGLLAALVIDRFDRKTALLTLVAGFTIGTLGCGFSTTYTALLIARVVTGAFGGVLGALIFAIIGDVIPGERRGAATGMVMASFALASIAGVPFGLFLGNKLGWQAPFLLLAGMGAVVGLAAMILMPSLRGHIGRKSEISPGAELRDILTEPNHLRAFALMDSLVFGSFTVLPFLAAAMVANAGIDEKQLMWLYVLGGACAFVSSPVVGRLSDRLGNLPVFRVMAVLSTLPLLALTNLPHVPLWVAMLVMASLMVCNSGRTVPAMAMITASVEPRRRGGFMSVNAALQHLSMALATLVAGLMVSQDHHGSPLKGFRTVGLLAVATTLVSLPLAGRLLTAKGGLDAVPEPGLE